MKYSASEHVHAEHALRESEQRLVTALRAARMVAYEWNLATDLVTVNARFREIFGIPDNAPLRGSKWLDQAVHPHSRATMDAAFGRAFAPASDGQFEFEFRVMTPNGADVWVLTAGQASFVGDGAERRPVRVYGSGIDITAQKTTEAALRESQAHLHLALDIAELGTWSWNLVTNEGSLDARAARLIGASPGYLADVPAAQRASIHPDDLVQTQAELAAGIAQGTTFSMAYRAVHPDGSVRYVVSQARVIADEAGHPSQLIGTNRDVTAEHEITAALRESEQRQAFLLTLSDALRPLADPAEAWQAACRVLSEHLGADGVLFSEIIPDSQTIVTPYSYTRGDAPPLTGQLPVADLGPSAATLRQGQPVVVADATTLGGAERAAYEAAGLVAIITVPLIKNSTWVANLTVYQHSPRRWTVGEIALSKEVAERLGAAIEHTRAEEALRMSEARLAADLVGMRRLYDLHARLAGETNLAMALEAIIAAATEFTGTDRGCVQFVSDNGERLEMFAWRGYTETSPFIEHFRYEGAKAACDMVREHKARFITEDIEHSPAFAGTRDREVALGENIRAAQSTPMFSRNGELIGVLSTQFRQPHRPTDDELRLIDLLVWMAADFVVRQRAEAALRASEEQLRLIIESAKGYAIFTMSEDGTIRSWNAGAAAIFGWSETEILGHSGNMLFTPEDRAVGVLQQELSVAAREGQASDNRWHLCKDGGRVYINGIVQPLFDAMGQLSGLVKIGRDLTAQYNAETALRQSEEKYRTLFNSIDEGFSLLEMIFNDENKIVDYWHREHNVSFTRLTGIHNAAGKRMSELVPNLEQEWYDRMESVFHTGEPVRVEYPVQQLNQWYTCYISRVGGEGSVLLAAVYNDITERKHADQRQAFLLQLSDALRLLADPVAIQIEASHLLGKHLHANRVLYIEVESDGDSCVIHRDYVDGVSSVVSRRSLSSYEAQAREKWLAGETVVYDDIEADESLSTDQRATIATAQVRAWLGVPLLKKGRLAAILAVHQSVPRSWHAHEIGLVVETAERTWAAVERARAEEALRVSEEHLRLATTAAGIYHATVELATGQTIFSDNVSEVVGYEMQKSPENISTHMVQIVAPEDVDRYRAAMQATMRGEGDLHSEVRSINPLTNERVWLEVHGTLINAPDGTPQRVVLVARNITERKHNQANLQFLTDISRDFSRLWTVEAIMQTVGEKLARFLAIQRCHFALIDEPSGECRFLDRWDAPNLPPLAPVILLSDVTNIDLLEPLRRQETVSSNVVASDPHMAEQHAKLGTSAYITVPFQQRGDWNYVFAVVSTSARVWRDDEIALVEEVASRLFPRLERARAEEALRASEERFRLFVTAVSDILYRMNADWREMRSLEGKGFLADTQDPSFTWLEQYIPDSDQPLTQKAITNAIRTKTTFELEHRVVRADGTMGWTFSRAIPLLDERGEIVEWFGAASDITERKRAEAALRESEARFRTLTDAVPQVIWTNAADGVANYFNERWFTYSGLSLEESFGRGWQAIVHPDDAPASGERWQAALAKGSVFDTEYRLRRADGAYHWHIGRNVPLRDNDGQVIGWFGTATDIEDRKQAEQAVQQANALLEMRVAERTAALATSNQSLQAEIVERTRVEADRAALLARIVTTQEEERQRIARELHDSLGQFLSALTVRLSTAQQLAGLPPQVQATLAELRAVAVHIDSEVDRLTMELRPPALDDMGLVDALVTYTTEWKVTSGVAVDLLSLGFEGARLPTDMEAAIYRIVQEALTNVAKHARASDVSITLEWRNGWVRTVVEDNGVGFVREVVEGSGVGGRHVGLIGMNERANLVGGALTIESVPDEGTTVYLRIPLRDVAK